MVLQDLSQHLRQMLWRCIAIGVDVADLGLTAESVRDDPNFRGVAPKGRGQRKVSDTQGDVVMVAFVAKVACQAAASVDASYLSDPKPG